MKSRFLSVVCGISFVALNALHVSASTVTWEAVGKIGNIYDPRLPSALSSIANGIPWTLDITFNPDTPAVLLTAPFTYYYPSAVSATRFQIGDFVYTNTGGSIFVNADLPAAGFGHDGLVQFQWQNGWSGGVGGPNLNGSQGPFGSGLLLAGYFDAKSCDGSLPTVPDMSASPCHSFPTGFGGLEFDDGGIGGSAIAQFTSSFRPYAVPEPAALSLLGVGLAALAVYRRRR